MAEMNCAVCDRLHETYSAATIRYMKFYEGKRTDTQASQQGTSLMASIPMGNSLLHDGSSVTSQPSTRILHSWKEIASYLGRGVRTIQRYEAQLGLPIHRPAAKERSAVLAFADELEQRLRSTPGRNGTHSSPTNGKSSAGPAIREIQSKHDLESELKRAEEDVKRVHAEYQRARELYDALKRRIEVARDASRKFKDDIQKRNAPSDHVVAFTN